MDCGIAACCGEGNHSVARRRVVLERTGQALDRGARAARGGQGWTDLVITPERGFHVVDSMLTGFDTPNASHLEMLEALAGRDHLSLAYESALANRYLWHEFGDLHLIRP